MQAIDLSPDNIKAQTNFWTITNDNEVIFPRWEKQVFSQFWWEFFTDIESKQRLVSVGRAGGKTHMLCFFLILLSLEKYWEVKRSGIRYAGPQWSLVCVFPKMEQAKAAVAMLNEVIPETPGFAPDGFRNYRHRNSDVVDWKLFGENELEISVFSSFSASSLRSKSADILWIDEGAWARKSDFIEVLMPIADRPGRPESGGYVFASSTPDDDDVSLEQWWDDACDQASEKLPNVHGYFSDFKLYEAPFTANPMLSEERFQRILKQHALNPMKWQRERLAIRGLKTGLGTNPDGTVGNVWNSKQLEPCFYTQQPSPVNVEIAIDLAFGNQDALAVIYYDAFSRRVFDLEIHFPKEQQARGIQKGAYDKGIVDLFTTVAARFPGAPILYDATSEGAMPVAHIIPKHLRTVPIKKTNPTKVGLVQTLIERMQQVNEQGVCTGIQFPHPDAPWLTDRQRHNFKRLYSEMVNFQKQVTVGRDQRPRIIYSKPQTGGSDDALDALLLLMSNSKPQEQQGPVQSLTQLRRRGRGW